MNSTKRLTVCAMTAALGIVVMLLGYVIGIGTYAAPLLVSLFTIPVLREYGGKYLLMVWLAISILSFILVRDAEQSMMYALLFGWYPAARERLEKLCKPLRIAAKLLIFNAVTIAMELLLIKLIAPSAESPLLLWALLIVGNAVFLLYDMIIPRFLLLYEKRFRKHLFK